MKETSVVWKHGPDLRVMQDFWCEVKVLIITMSNSCYLWFCWQLAGERQTPAFHN